MTDNLLNRIKVLEKENQELRIRLAKYEVVDYKNIKFTKDEKINLFKQYFIGREDVVANRYYDNKKQRYGYAILCYNDFRDNICLKKRGGKINCLTCPNRDFVPYTGDLIFDHFTKRDKHIVWKKDVYLGIYPLLKDTTCKLIALDFDEGNWMDEMLSVYHMAQRYCIESVMERSQSGYGGHLWIFFQDAIPATKARNLGKLLLKMAMKENKTLQISSFDRMFPNQDYISDEGIGNLIALPLQYDAFQKGNSVFINEVGQMIENPIGYLSAIKKLTEAEVNTILAQDEKEDYFFEGNQIALSLGTNMKYSEHLEVIEDSMLHISKINCNSLTLNMIRRLSSMINPEYYLKMKLRKPIFKTRYTISEYIETESYITIPRGCKDKFLNVFANADIQIQDKRNNGHEIDVSFKGELKNQQIEAIQSLLKYDTGVLHAVAGFGKTVMAIYAIAQKKTSTLIIVPTIDLKKQWLERIDEFLTYPSAIKKKDAYIGEFTGSKKNLKGNLDIATIQSLSKCDDLKTLLAPYGFVIIDECHHIPSQSFRIVMRNIKSTYIYGFSATPDRKDGLEKIMYMYCGEKRYETNKKLIISQRTFLQYLIPHFTNVKLLEIKDTYQEIIDEIYLNEHRNFMIANDIITEFRNNRKSIVLSERIDHLQILYEKIRDVSPNIFVLTSDMKTSDRKQIGEQIKEVAKLDNYIVLATSKLLGEGFDLPSLDTLFLTLPVSDKNRIEQYTGRIHREFEGKEVVYVHDYVDVHIPMMEAMFQKRLKAYHQEGYVTKTNERGQDEVTFLYSEDTYLPTLLKDLEFAKKRILISNSSITLGKIKKHFKLLQSLYTKGISITFYISEAIDNKTLKFMKGTGANIIPIERKQLFNMIIIDRDTVWYGDINVFGRSKKGSSFIRFVNQLLAEEMMEDFTCEEV